MGADSAKKAGEYEVAGCLTRLERRVRRAVLARAGISQSGDV